MIVGNVAFVALFLSQKKKNVELTALVNEETLLSPADDEQPLNQKASYQAQIEDSLQQLSQALPELMPCSDPQAFANASDQEQAKIIRYMVLDYEKQIIDNIEMEDELAAPFVESINQLFPGISPEDSAGADSAESSVDIDTEIEKLNQQNKMNQEVIDQFARESREMLNCISTLENENKDLRKLINVKTDGQ